MEILKTVLLIAMLILVALIINEDRKKANYDELFMKAVDDQLKHSKMFREAWGKMDVESMKQHNDSIQYYSKKVKEYHKLISD